VRAGRGAAQEDAEREYFVGQFKALSKRHSVEEVMLVRVLTDHYQLVANTAKSGELDEAKRLLASLAREVELPADDEIRHSVRVAELPVRALVHWLEGEASAALDRLRDGLQSGGRLAGTYGHDYLTSRRIYIGVNVVRVLITTEDFAGASRLIDSLAGVAAGDRGRWPFSEPDSLDVPLHGLHEALIAWHLERMRSRVLSLVGS
jgi:hypothetical protein